MNGLVGNLLVGLKHRSTHLGLPRKLLGGGFAALRMVGVGVSVSQCSCGCGGCWCVHQNPGLKLKSHSRTKHTHSHERRTHIKRGQRQRRWEVKTHPHSDTHASTISSVMAPFTRPTVTTCSCILRGNFIYQRAVCGFVLETFTYANNTLGGVGGWCGWARKRRGERRQRATDRREQPAKMHQPKMHQGGPKSGRVEH